MEAEYILSNQVNIGRPVVLKSLLIMQIPDSSNIIAQGIEPDIDYMLIIYGKWYSPIKGGSGNAEIIQPLFDKADHFIPTAFRLYKMGIIFYMLQQSICILAQFKEIALFFYPFQ